MTKKSLNKLLSVVLTLAICFTTVFGCLMTASAADSATCYSWSDGEVDEDLTSATINLTIVAPNNMSLGIYSALIDIASEEDALIFEGYEIVSGSLKSGGEFSAENYNIDVEDETVLFLETIPVDDEVVIEDYLLSSITLKLSFSFADGTAKNGSKYYAKLAQLSLADGFGAEVEYAEGQLTSNGLIDAGCDHVIAVKGSPINVDTNNEYAVYAESYCTLCGEDNLGYQLVPSTKPMNGVTISWSAEGAYDDNLIDPEDGEQKGTADSPIIINSVEELYSLAMRTKWNDSLNKYYKLADGIDNVVLQSEKYASAITSLENSDEVNQLFSTDGWYNWAPSTLDSPYAFAGHFDGNGATFYGMYAKNKNAAGLFPIVYYTDKTVTQDYITSHGNAAVVANGEVSVSNLNVTNSYLYGTTRMGFIAGSSIITTNPTATETAGYYADWCLKVENCSVYGNYMYSSTSGTNSLNQNGLIVGLMNDFYRFTGGPYSGAKCAYIKDCLVYGNDNKTVNNYTDSISITGNFGRGAYHDGSKVLFEKLIVLGASPYLSTGDGKNTPSSHASHKERFKSVYTDASTTVDYSGDSATYDITYPTTAITGINANDVKGYNAVTSCPNLDWGTNWSYGAEGEYPSLGSNDSGIIYWNGKNTEVPTKTDENGTYIIENAEQFAHIVSAAGPAGTTGKNYKIADGIDTIILQPYDVIIKAGGLEKLMSLSTPEEVNAFFNQDGIEFKNWCLTTSIGLSGGSLAVFNGNFDGNGVEVYGLYIDGSANTANTVAGLFLSAGGGTADANGEDNTGIVIENVSLINSYINNARRVGAIVGGCFNGSYGAGVNGTVTLNNCGVINNYLRATYKDFDGAAVVVGSNGSQVIHINNALVYGNYGVFVDTDNDAESLLSLYYDGTDRFGRNADGSFIVDKDGNKSARIYSTVKNSIILGTTALADRRNNRTSHALCYTNVYTDVAKTGTTYGTFTDNNIKVLASKDDAIGTQAKDNMPNLKWGTEWYASVNGYPTLAALDEVRVATESNSSMGLVGSNVAYNNDGSLDFNFHFIPVEGYEPVLYVGKADKSGYTEFLTCTDPVPSSARAELGEDAMMLTIPNLSSRDINTVWVPTLVATNGAVIEWGKSQSIALADYANGVLNEEVVYGDDVTEEIKIADKRVAAALLNYADAATLALYAENDVPAAKNKIVYYNGGAGVEPTKLLDSSKPNSESNPYIIETPQQMLWLVKEGYANTKGKYYKVADDVKAFVLQTESKVNQAGGVNELMNLDKDGVMKWFDNPNKTAVVADGTDKYMNGSTIRTKNSLHSGPAFSNTNEVGVDWQNWNIATTNASKCFEGHFDGNGVNIYGFFGKSGAFGLFGSLNGATIKNINIKSSYGCGYMGGLIGNTHWSSTADMTITNTIENITISNSCVISYRTIGNATSTTANTDAYTSVGVMCGPMNYNLLNVNNCFASDVISYQFLYDGRDAADAVGTLADIYDYKTNGNTLSLIGAFANGDTAEGVMKAKVSNTVGLGITIHITPKHNWDNNGGRQASFSNCYTDKPTTAANGLAFANNNTISYSATQIKQITDLESLKGAAAKTTLSFDFESKWMATAGYPQPIQSGYTAPEGGNTIYWDGNRTEPTTGDGTKENPIIINTAAELAYVAYQGIDYTTNGAEAGYTPKYFKIADGIDKIVLQKDASYGDAILALDNVTDVKDYFNKTSGLLQWTDKAFRAWNGGYFGGHFDGNGVEIYGMYAKASSKYLSLFPNVDGGATIENVSIVNAYMKSTNTDGQGYRAAAFVSNVGQGSAGTGSDEWTVTINNCKVANSYFSAPQNTATDAGVLVAAGGGSNFAVSNCIVYGNEAYYNNKVAETKGKLFGDFRSVSSSSLSNSIILDVSPTIGADTCTDAFFSNVYTNETTSFSTVTTIDANEIKGSKAADIVDKFNAANGKTVWYVGAIGDYPGFSEADALPSTYKAEYDAVVLDKFNVSPKGGTENFGFYSTSINLRANPYMSFIFNFGEDYKTNRDDIKVTFTYTVGGNEITKTINVPAYEEGKDLKADGWSNLATSKKHTFQFTDLPVQALVNGVNVVITYGDESVDCGSYSAKGTANAFVNANKKTPCSYYEKCAEATKALVYYTQALTARYGN